MATERARNHAKRKPVAREKVSVATVGELRTNFRVIEARLAKGMKVQITRHGTVIAEVQSPVSARDETAPAASMPDFEERLRRIWGERPLKVDTTALVSEGRERGRLS